MTGLSATLPVQRLDLRGLDPPEPLRRALEAIETLGPGGMLEIITDREPLLLHRELSRRQHAYLSEARADGFCTAIHRSGEQGTPP